MTTVNLRLVKWLGTVPAVGICTHCERNFKVPPDSVKRTSDAQESLRKQFVEHKCKREGVRQAATLGFPKQNVPPPHPALVHL
jgi:hypothetical protein